MKRIHNNLSNMSGINKFGGRLSEMDGMITNEDVRIAAHDLYITVNSLVRLHLPIAKNISSFHSYNGTLYKII